MTELVVWSSDVHLSPKMTSPAHARDFVGQRLAEHGLTYLIDDVRLVASELVTNAAVHARTRIKVSVAELLFCVRLTVFDDCVDLLVRPTAGGPDDDAEGGRGLWITQACSSGWGTDMGHGWKSVWALFPVRPQSSWIEASNLDPHEPQQSQLPI